ncbi:hypothetical protein AMECASPLE_030928 [Ameca splendens]|uniref:Uncharacterized protein n=1 Tax=Ameca splendens TaxID=208324 RepID=A0ABV0ZFU6_9TELE
MWALKSPTRMTESQRPSNTPTRDAKKGRVLRIAAWPVGRNNSQRPLPDPKGQGCNPLIHQGKHQHETSELGGNKQTNASPPPLSAGNSMVEDNANLFEGAGFQSATVR